jgi:hypothetical protein
LPAKANRIAAILHLIAAADGTLHDMARGTEVPDDSDSRYEGLDADERAEARAMELRQAQVMESDLAWGPPPLDAGTVLRFRSMWTVIGVVVIAGAVVGAVSSQQLVICSAVGAVGLLMTSHGLGSVRRIEITRTGAGDLALTGGLLQRTVLLRDFDWARAYDHAGGRLVKVPALVVLYRSPGRHLFAKVIAEYFPRVSKRRTVIIFSSLWRLEGKRRRIPDHAMNDLFRRACRANGMTISDRADSRWIARQRQGG